MLPRLTYRTRTPTIRVVMEHSVQARTRLWRDIADELIREANTERMALLTKELNRRLKI